MAKNNSPWYYASHPKLALGRIAYQGQLLQAFITILFNTKEAKSLKKIGQDLAINYLMNITLLKS
jgi:hypothetical protein